MSNQKKASISKRADAVLMKTQFQGLDIHLDRPTGFRQTLDTPEGKKVRKYLVDYGFFPGTKDHDGEELDVFLGEDPSSDRVWVIRQNKHDGSFDEHKIMMGFEFEGDAMRAYTDHIPVNLMAGVEEMSVDSFTRKFLKKKKAHTLDAAKLAERFMRACLRTS